MHRSERMIVAGFLALALPVLAAAAELEVILPLGRVAYQTNEWIDVSVVRTSPQALATGTLVLTVSGDDGSSMQFAFPLGAVPAEGEAGAARTEHLHLNGWLMRPGTYTVTVTCDGATANARIEVCSNVRKSTFRIIDWGCGAKGAEQAVLGEDSMGFNLVYASYGGFDQNANIRGGLDYMRNDALGGAHQMDGRLECDWSDPYVLAGGHARAARQALADRTSPNTIGVHFYDEPGLTWMKHPKTGEFIGHNIPAQDRAYRSAFGVDSPQYNEVKKDDAESVRRWRELLRWKQGFMDAAWKQAAEAVSRVRADYISATQSQYGWHAFGDGYYFNVVRSLPVISGHGGYDDYAGGYVNPGLYCEFGRIRDLNKPVWYLPTWWGMPAELFRLEQYLTFMMNVQGLCKPPGMAIHTPDKCQPMADGIVESNKLMLRLGTIFTTMPVTRPDVAVLYSMSQNTEAQLKNMMNFQDFPGQLEKLLVLSYAGKMSHIGLFPIVEEDVLDGTLAANHKAVVLTGIEYLEPNVIAALEAYAAGGGRVIASDDCTVQIKGAAKLGVAITSDIYKKAGEAFRKGAQEGRIAGLLARRPGVYFKAAAPVADALTKRCKDIGVLPALDCSNRQVFVSRQGQGDVEYFFAVNATCDESVLTGVEHMNAIKGASATIAVPDDGRPVYDAIYGDAASEFAKKGKTLTADLRFGAGQMRVYARTARPIGGVQVLSPVIRRDFTVEAGPQFAELTACVVDGGNRALAGAIPLEVKLLDPLGVTRYNLYRATDNGMLRLRLPLAINDPAGEWKLSVRELLSNTEGQASFAYKPPKQCGALAGATHRAVYFGNEPENVYRFLGRQKEITVVAGSSEFNSAAAARLADALKPWDVRCTVVPAADVKPRVLDDDAKKTWTGLVGGGSTGFDVRGGAILLGNPDDNQLIKYLRDQRFLPYAPDKAAFPGRGKAMIAWQVDGIGYYGIESVAVIAYDAAGMADGVGTLFEWASGLDPLTKWALPATAGVSPATKAPGFLPEPGIIWRAVLPDRVVAMKADGNTVSALTLDHSISTITAAGKVKSKEVSREDAAKQAAEWKQAVSAGSFPRDDAKAFDVPARVVKVIAKGDGATAVGYWGGLIRVYDANGVAVASIMMPHDVGAIVWLDGQLVAGLSDGTVAAMKTR